MRGIPEHLATPEDYYNVALGLPPAKAFEWLKSLTVDDVRGKLNAEEFYLLKARVGDARWKEQCAADRRMALEIEREGLLMEIESARRECADASREIAIATIDANTCRSAIKDIERRLVEEKPALQVEVEKAETELQRLDLQRRELMAQVIRLNRKMADISHGLTTARSELDRCIGGRKAAITRRLRRELSDAKAEATEIGGRIDRAVSRSGAAAGRQRDVVKRFEEVSERLESIL